MRKNILFPILALSICVGCDIIQSDERYNDLTITVQEKNRRVLLEDFTGQECVNCPAASKVASAQKEIHKENLIVVSIHAGGFSRPQLRTPEGIEYDKYFHPKELGYPAGMINRSVFDKQTIFTNPDVWGGYILSHIQQTAKLDLTIVPTFDIETRLLDLQVIMDSEIDLSDTWLQLWVVESGIVAPQKGVNQEGAVISIPDYVHNHVLRGAINGTWGEPIALKANTPYTHTVTAYTLASKWNAENITIVGFIYLKSNSEIIQCQEIGLISKENAAS